MVFTPLNECQIKEKTNKILSINKERLEQFSISPYPLVSIIILNRNGKQHLETLFNSLKDNTIYPNYEIIIFDNESKDDSINLIKTWSNILPITLIPNPKNESFSTGNNLAALKSNGDFLLFLNNDVNVTYGWLTELIRIFYEYDNIGAVGGKLLYPYLGNTMKDIKKNLKVQHSGVAIKKTSKVFNPYNMGNGLEPYDNKVDTLRECLALTGAMLLIKKEVFFQVNGFEEQYNYGLEDVDICLKIIRLHHKIIYTPQAMAFHFESATIKKEKFSLLHNRALKNLRIFNDIWSDWLMTDNIDIVNIQHLGTLRK